LGRVQPGRRVSEVKLFSDRDEISKMPELHDPLSSSKRLDPSEQAPRHAQDPGSRHAPIEFVFALSRNSTTDADRPEAGEPRDSPPISTSNPPYLAGWYWAGIGLSGRSTSQATEAIHQRLPSRTSCIELIPR
jgi:hypothetical protein